jgi:hypothetical protein
MRNGFRIRSIPGALLVVLAVFGCVDAAFADGGRLRFREPAGPFIVTLFTTPDPLTTGHADFSVAIERTGVPGLVEDVHVDFILTPATGHGRQLVLHASHAAATSKWLQAANFSLPAQGLWQVTVVVRRGQEAGRCSGEVRVKDVGARDMTWDILPVPLAALLIVLHENRKRKYNRNRRTGRSSPAFQIRS